MKKGINEILLINPDIVFRDIENERFLFNPKTGHIQVINEIGRFIFENCNGRFTKKGIIELVKKNYKGGNPKKITKEVNGFLEKMLSENWIQMIERQST